MTTRIIEDLTGLALAAPFPRLHSQWCDGKPFGNSAAFQSGCSLADLESCEVRYKTGGIIAAGDCDDLDQVKIGPVKFRPREIQPQCNQSGSLQRIAIRNQSADPYNAPTWILPPQRSGHYSLGPVKRDFAADRKYTLAEWGKIRDRPSKLDRTHCEPAEHAKRLLYDHRTRPGDAGIAGVDATNYDAVKTVVSIRRCLQRFRQPDRYCGIWPRRGFNGAFGARCLGNTYRLCKQRYLGNITMKKRIFF